MCIRDRVKVNTQAELEVILPRAPKVLGKDAARDAMAAVPEAELAQLSLSSGAAAPGSWDGRGAPVARAASTAGDEAGKDAGGAVEKAREKWIYVWDMHSRLYINRKLPGRFHHSSFVAGGAVKAAGSIVVENGELKQLTTWSGHYRPRSSDIALFLEWLEAKHVNMSHVELLLVKPHKQAKVERGKAR